MTDAMKTAYGSEMHAARTHFAAGDFGAAFSHLERAHILSQRNTGRHAFVHCWMLRVGVARRDAREVLGQCARTIAALFFSRIWVPAGNTGGANVSAFAPMAIPEDLARLMREERR